jgi:hypothetical protein
MLSISVDLAGVFSNANMIVTGLVGLVAVVGGINLGFSIINWLINMFRGMKI